jgi:multicomponent Na+:H+ antiporter subunit C
MTTLYGLLGAALVGIGLFGLLVRTDALLRILAFNVMGGGIFLVFGAVARRGAGAGFAADPVPQAIILTGIVVAFAATTLAVALVVRIAAADPARDGTTDAP